MPAKLLTEADKKALPYLYSQEDVEDPLVVVKWFSPYNNWRWYAVEGEEGPEGWVFFGLVKGFEDEMGYWRLDDLDVKGMGGKLPLVEKDLYWQPTPLSRIRSGEVT